MTVNYLDQVATVGFSLRLLKQWRGSLQKAIWEDLAIFLTCFFSISISYRCIISRESLVHPDYKDQFDSLCVYCRESRKLIPISFLLGFYVTMVVQRWWEQLCCLATPDELAIHLVSYIPGPGTAREFRRTIVRWACLSTVLTLRKVSDNVLQRFPEYSDLVEAGMLTEKEEIKLLILDEKTGKKYSNNMHPIKWAKVMLRMAFQKGLIIGNNDNLLQSLSEDVTKIYDKNFELLRYSSVPIPLLYTQVIIIAVYTYFLACIFGNQYLTRDHENDKDGIPDLYVPIFTILEFIFYVGWLKVGSALINPFGDDDDDFDIDDLIDNNLEMGFLLVEDEEIEMKEVSFDKGNLQLHPQGHPNILISAEWWETNQVLEGQDDTGTETVEYVSSKVSSSKITLPGEHSVRNKETGKKSDGLTVPGANSAGLKVLGANSAGLTVPGANSAGLTVPGRNSTGSTVSRSNSVGLTAPGGNSVGLMVSGANVKGLKSSDSIGLTQLSGNEEKNTAILNGQEEIGGTLTVPGQHIEGIRQRNLGIPTQS